MSTHRFNNYPIKTDTKLRIGYLSSNFINHAQGTQLEGYFKLHDRVKYEIFAFSIRDAMTEEAKVQQKTLRSEVDHFLDLTTLSDIESAKTIHNLGIDILIDLCGLADGGRLGIMAMTPSPVQISFLGYPGTTGAKFIDYYVGDKISTPQSMAGYFSESLILMPHTYQVTEHKYKYPVSFSYSADYDDPDVDDIPITNSEYYEGTEKPFVYANFNQHAKIDPDIFDLWMEILHEVPRSRLWLLDGPAKTNLRKRAELKGVDPSRIKFKKSIPKKNHLHRLANNVDLFLDTWIYNAHTSAGDALWAGVPIITKIGSLMMSRVCASMISACGFWDEMVVDNIDQYKLKSIQYANDDHLLENLRTRINSNKTNCPLFDTEKYVKNFEDQLQHIWKSYTTEDRVENHSMK
eukprot:TRINITY_DN108_c1_g1_i3.p1 TRINITY_DN108_c1_g1~~TRINITY_DN108_c1_g1_i3.p1  ORF type:complete len:406 (+),score=41.67 TRINITY_DN108_c1_g1_i3:410-1627(+)